MPILAPLPSTGKVVLAARRATTTPMDPTPQPPADEPDQNTQHARPDRGTTSTPQQSVQITGSATVRSQAGGQAAGVKIARIEAREVHVHADAAPTASNRIAAITIVLALLGAVLVNVAASSLPAIVQRCAWAAWPLAGLVTLLSIAVAIRQNWPAAVWPACNTDVDWLWGSGVFRRDIIGFCDCCPERILLRRIGAGWIFVHRLLLEYFADLYEEAGRHA